MVLRKRLAVLKLSGTRPGYLRCAFARARQWTAAGVQVMNFIIVAAGYYRGISVTATDRLRGNR